MSLRGIAGSIRSMPMKYCSYSARKRSRRLSSSSSATSSSAFSTRSALQGGDGEIVEAGRDFPVIEREVFVSSAEQRAVVLEAQDLDLVHEVTDGLAVSSLYFEAIRSIGQGGLGARVALARLDLQRFAVRAVLVQARQDVQRIFPAAKDDEVAGRVGIGISTGRALAVAPGLGLEVAIGRSAGGLEFDASVRRQAATEPSGVIVCVAHAQATLFDRPTCAGEVPIRPGLAAVEVVDEALFELRAGRRFRRSAGIVPRDAQRLPGALGRAARGTRGPGPVPVIWALVGHAGGQGLRGTH